MTSNERHERRYQRRKAARLRRKQERLGEYDNFDLVKDANNLVLAFKKSKSGVEWKASVQRYEMNLLKNINKTVKDLEDGATISQGFIVFWLCERGKLRRIKSVHIRERVVQRSFCDNTLIPVLQNGLVYDNGASMEGKGIHFHLRRIVAQLQKFYRSNGFSNDGYILVIDFSGYFDNILHAPIYEELRHNFKDERILKLAYDLIHPFCEDREDSLEKSLGIGSQISQICAVRYPNDIDHTIEQDCGVASHARYMDDTYAIDSSKERLIHTLEVIDPLLKSKGIILNPKKTQIVKLSSWFKFLKWKIKLTDTGKVVMKPAKDSIVRERRKIKKLKTMLDDGNIAYDDIRSQYDSWKGYVSFGNSHNTIRNMDKLYDELFIAAGEWR